MEELTKEQRQIIEEEIKKEIKKANTFLKPELINKIIQDIIGDIKGKINNKFKCPKNLEEILSSIPQKVYVSLGKEEIKQILKLDFCCFVDNVFYIDSAPKIEPYEHNQNKTAIEEQRIIQCSYDDLLYLFKTYPLIFNHCIFDYKIDKKTPIEQIKKLSFLNCNFKKEVYLNFQECLDSFQMDNCVFEDRVTIKGKFNDNVYFNNSIFKNYADFHECEFEKTANFYGVRFNKTPNFSQAIFRGNLNAVNANLNFTFDDLQERIKQEYEDFNKNIENKKSLDKFANDFRDSFRTFKNALIKDNNLLDASNFHKYELYCKEIELKNKKGKTFKDVVDRWQLFFYCKLCDHHTDILQSLNSLILVIGIFVISSVAMVFGFNYSLGYKPISEHWYFSLDFYNHHINSIIQDNYLFMMAINIMILFIYLGLIGFALCLKYMRKFFIIISYAITLSVLVVSPKILIPAMGFFTDKRAILDPLSAIGGIYTIVFGFVVFSFIKTIRKNSIVPS
ncbi:pentapeptide repeat-containing protein [Campylobacter coli]|nr:pentapeptide repeat-containing protein [Campylobacter coli]EBF5511177.1 pentapeptide repeat-containing protein [Campylobacter coli]EBI2433011.1 pentapeptide repeat-containing protein [Campylobacter coli]ECQ8176689.1 pentapeptide repeat-containing protein [Campylobacter coli]EDO7818814.1 pentapeptide repeat-containing protein [Campylobacter coli]